MVAWFGWWRGVDGSGGGVVRVVYSVNGWLEFVMDGVVCDGWCECVMGGVCM